MLDSFGREKVVFKRVSESIFLIEESGFFFFGEGVREIIAGL